MRPPRALVLALLTGGCGPLVAGDELGTTTTESSGGTQGGTTSAPPATESSSDASDGSTTALPDPTGYEDDGGTGCSFTCPDPPPPSPPPGIGGSFECDIASQNCPDGEKCMPWDNTGGSEWNATRCSPIADDPDGPGEPCTVEGSPTSGVDSCTLHSICWQVDPKTIEGTCHPLCEAVDGEYSCEPPFECAQLAFGIPLCVQPCDPLASSCPEGQSCAFEGSALICRPLPLGGALEGEMCHPEDDPCQDGTLCSYDPAARCHHLPGTGCCAAPCDVNDPSACRVTEVCLPWFPVAPPPELAHLGVCAAP
jgi:hypothetical protein